MKILLHTCCAPCLIYPLERLRGKGFEVEGLFYNPNIHPSGEYTRRQKAVELLSEEEEILMIYPEYQPPEFFWAIHSKESSPERCLICWRLRMEATAREARKRGSAFFSTTLLVSPYQSQDLLKSIGTDVARQEEIEFYYEDFRPGFREAHATAKEKELYCQKYCGCIYSEVERCRKSAKA